MPPRTVTGPSPCGFPTALFAPAVMGEGRNSGGGQRWEVRDRDDGGKRPRATCPRSPDSPLRRTTNCCPVILMAVDHVQSITNVIVAANSRLYEIFVRKYDREHTELESRAHGRTFVHKCPLNSPPDRRDFAQTLSAHPALPHKLLIIF